MLRLDGGARCDLSQARLLSTLRPQLFPKPKKHAPRVSRTDAEECSRKIDGKAAASLPVAVSGSQRGPVDLLWERKASFRRP